MSLGLHYVDEIVPRVLISSRSHLGRRELPDLERLSGVIATK